MLIFRIAIISLIFLLFFDNSKQDEVICTVNGKKTLHQVSEHFLSVSIDPAVLLTGLNLSETSIQLAKHLSPAYIRIAGPSTQFVKYIDTEDKSFGHSSEDTTNVIVTPSMWFGINEWLTLANLTPVFGINDIETAKGVWNPKSTLPLLEISDKLNVTCLWQLGYDCSNKTELQYKGDLMIFRHILDAFPERKDTWKIIGSDISKCHDIEHIDGAKRVFDDLEDTINAIMWEPETKDELNFIEKDTPAKLFPSIKSKIPIWTTAPKTLHPICFSSAISWARQIGEAAKLGYEVVFRQPRLHEIFTDTPAYWVSILHKKLMGRNVLDVKSTGFNSQASVYAHCTKKQNSFVRRGAMTILVVNNGTSNHTALVRIGTGNIRNTEVQSYILTSSGEDSTDTYLNGEKLNFEKFNEERIPLMPKIRRAKLMQYLSLSVPPKSVGFFVLPVARIAVCINEEEEIKLLMEEIRQDQNIPFSKEVSVDIFSRSNLKKTPTLRELQDLIEKELESDEKYYQENDHKGGRNKKVKPKEFKIEENLNNEIRHFFIERAKLAEKQKKQVTSEHKKSELIQLLKEKSRELANKELSKKESSEKQINFELSSVEIRKILTDRAKSRAAKKNIKFTSAELEELMAKATEKLIKNNNTAIKLKSKGKRSADKQTDRNKKDINTRLLNLRANKHDPRLLKKHFESLSDKLKKLRKNRQKRDINMDLLKLKTDGLLNNKNNKKPIKNKFKNKEIKEATMRQPYQTSEELLRDDEESEEDEAETKRFLPKGEIFAKMATAEETETEEIDERKPLIPKPLFSLPKPVLPKFDLKLPTKAPKYERTKPVTKDAAFSDKIQILTASDGVLVSEEEEEEIPCIHEYFGPQVKVVDGNNQRKFELWEIDEIPVVEKNDNALPYLSNRGFAATATNVDNKFNWDQYFKEDGNLKQVEELDMSLENDYGDLDSDEKHPVRFRRSTNNIEKAITKNETLKGGNDNGSIRNKYYYVVGKAYDPSKIKINDKKKNKQIKLLKKRYNLKKKIDEKKKQRKMEQKTSRNIRSAYELNNNLNNKYKSLTSGLKIWKPADILNLKQSNFVTPRTVNLQPINDVSIFKSYFNRNTMKKKQKRNVHNIEINSIENEIDSFMNEVVKDTKIIHPEIDRENGDYQVIFPNKDKIAITETHGDTEIKFMHHTTESVNNEIISGVSAIENSTEIISNLHNSTDLKEGCDNKHETSLLMESNIEKIPLKKRKDSFIESMFHGIAEIFHDLTKKIQAVWNL